MTKTELTLTISGLILTFIGILIASYSFIEPQIKMVNAIPKKVDTIAFVPLPDGRIASKMGIIIEFENKSLKPGFIKNLNIVADGIDPKDYETEILFLDKSKIGRFSKKDIQIKIRIIYKNLSTLKKSDSFQMCFYDNLDNQIQMEKSDTVAWLKIGFQASERPFN